MGKKHIGWVHTGIEKEKYTGSFASKIK